jgi:ABC-type antimicrobial peptide transport system permease subunit
MTPRGVLKPNRSVVYWLQPSIEKHAYLDQIVLRLKGDPASGRKILQRTIERIVPAGVHFKVFSGQEGMDRALYPYRFVVMIALFLGVVAVLLTMSGIFGMLSYVIAQRRKESGIRIALGAGKARVTGMVLRQSLRLTAAGAVLGTLLALLTARALSRSALGPRFDLFDVGGYVLGLLLVVATALAAAWIPARRAVNLDPARTLHTE